MAAYDGAGDDWDAFVASQPGSSFCHLGGWREVMQDVLGHEPRYDVVVDPDGVWHGALPLVRVQTRLFGGLLLSMPFLNYGGPIGSVHARRLLFARALAEARQRRTRLLELRIRGAGEASAPQARKITVTLPLPSTAEELWVSFRSKLRSQIRRPQRAGMETRFGAEHRDAFYEVFSRNMRDLGTPVLPRTFFERVARLFPQQVTFGVVYKNSTPVAAGCGFAWAGEFEMTWASSLREISREAPNMLLYWAFMEQMIERGLRTFNFGRCTPDTGTHRFKRQWGGTDETLPWLTFSPRGRPATPYPERPMLRAATAAWSRLPLRVANAVGPVLARQLP